MGRDTPPEASEVPANFASGTIQKGNMTNKPSALLPLRPSFSPPGLPVSPLSLMTS